MLLTKIEYLNYKIYQKFNFYKYFYVNHWLLSIPLLLYSDCELAFISSGLSCQVYFDFVVQFTAVQIWSN